MTCIMDKNPDFENNPHSAEELICWLRYPATSINTNIYAENDYNIQKRLNLEINTVSIFTI